MTLYVSYSCDNYIFSIVYVHDLIFLLFLKVYLFICVLVNGVVLSTVIHIRAVAILSICFTYLLTICIPTTLQYLLFNLLFYNSNKFSSITNKLTVIDRHSSSK